MGDNKKFYWLKLQHDFFRQPRIKKLRKIAGGDTYTIIYLELQLLSLSNNGVLVFEGIEDDFIEELALTLDEDVDNVKMTVIYLIKHGLIEEVKEDEYALIETMKNIGSETQVAKRVREHRKKVKALQCNTDVTMCNTEKEIEKDKEIDLDIEEEKEVEKKKKETFVSLIESYTTDPLLISTLKNYVEMRKKMKGYTTHALKINLNTLSKLTDDDATKVAIVEQSIGGSWRSFYPLKNSVEKESKEKPREKPLPSWLIEQRQEESKNEHLENLKEKYRLYSKWGNEEETEKITKLYHDLTGRDIEQDI